MSNLKEIEIGDGVVITWGEGGENLVSISGNVLSRPAGEGDSWTIETTTGKIVNVQRYDMMCLSKKGESIF